MDKLSFKLDDFYGPIDLLLHLIIKNKMNITDIVITDLLTQYLDFIEMSATLDYEISSEFLAMAARLIYMKTLALLPKNEELINLKKELENAVFLYAIYKNKSEELLSHCVYGSLFTREAQIYEKEPLYKCFHNKIELYNSYLSIIGVEKLKKLLTKELFAPITNPTYISVTTKIIFVLRKLYKNGSILYNEFFSSIDKSENISTFLALLELINTKRIQVSNDNKFIVFSGKFKSR